MVKDLAQKKEITMTQIMRHALRLYQSVMVRSERGETMCFINERGERCDVKLL